MKKNACRALLSLGFLFLGSSVLAQTTYTGTYTFGTNGNVTEFVYNGTDIPGVTIGSLKKVGVTTSSSSGNFRGTAWPLDPVVGTLTGVIDTSKYFEFTLTAVEGASFDMSSFTFGIGRSATGPRQWEWRSSVDGFTVAVTNYTTLNASLSEVNGVITNPDVNSGWNGNVLDLAQSRYAALTSVTFRLYGYNSEAGTGSGGLQGPFSFSVVVTAPEGSPTVSITTAATNVPFETTSIDISGTANESTVGELSWTNSLTGNAGSIAAATNWTISAVALDIGANIISVSGTNAAGDTAQSSVTIMRNDFLPTNVQFTASAATVAEASLVYTVTVRKTVSVGDVSGEVSLSGSATLDSDYSINTTNFVMNGSNTTATFEVTIVNDELEETAETIVLTLTNVLGGTTVEPSVFTLTISGNDGVVRPIIISQYYEVGLHKWIELFNPGYEAVNLSTAGYRLALWSNADREGWKTNSTATSTLVLTGVIPAGGTYLVGGSSTVLPAYAVPDQTSGTINFNGDDSMVLFSGDTYNFDNVIDVFGVTNSAFGDISYVRAITVTNGVNTDFNSADWVQFTLNDVDLAAEGTNPYLGYHSLVAPVTPTVQFALESASVSETGVTYDVTITKSAASGEVSGEITVGGTAPGADYSLGTTNISLIGEVTSQVVSITIVDNAADDGDRTVILGLANLVNADPGAITNFTLTIQDDDEAVVPELPVDLPIGSVTMVGGNVQVSVNAVTGLYYYLVYPNVALSAISVDPIDVNQWGVASSDGPNASGVITLEDSGASVPGRNYGVLIRTEDLFPEP